MQERSLNEEGKYPLSFWLKTYRFLISPFRPAVVVVVVVVVVAAAAAVAVVVFVGKTWFLEHFQAARND